MTNFKLDIKALKSCVPAMSKEETRYYLKGVHIVERAGVLFYEATNGHFLIRVESEIEQEEDISGIDIIIPAFICNYLNKPAFLKGFSCEGDYIDCNIDSTRINIEMIDGIINFKLISGTFPELEKVIPKQSTLKLNEVHINSKHMDAIGKSIKVFTGTTLVNLAFSSDEYGSPMLIKQTDFPNWLCALMPCRN